MSRTTRRRLLTGIGGFAVIGLGGWAANLRQPPTRPPVDEPVTAAITSTAPRMPVNEPATAASSPAPTTTTTAVQTSSEMTVVCRAAWGAREPSGEMDPHRVERLTLHHTAVLLEHNADAPGRARAHQRYHQQSGFADLAYHFMVDLEGNILEGRNPRYAGDTFTDYDPSGHLLICCEGDYDRQLPTTKQISSLALILAWASTTFDVAISTLSGHRDHASTSCPGDSLYAVVSDGSLVADAQAVARTRVVRVDMCGAQGESAVRAIESA